MITIYTISVFTIYKSQLGMRLVLIIL